MGNRLFIGVGAVLGVIVLLAWAVIRQDAGLPLPSPKAADAVAPMREEFDAIVVGSGPGGLAAAYELGKGGAQVLVVDMASVFGGHAVMATGDLCLIDTPFQREQGLQDSREIAFKDFMTWGEDPNPDWVRYYVDHSREEIYDWLTSLGVTFEELISPAGNSVKRTHRSKGRGIGVVTPIFKECARRPNIAFRWNTRVERLLNEKGRVTGVATRHERTQDSAELAARLVVLATGGFQSNLDMVREHWRRDIPFPERLLIGSGVNALGSGHEIARGAGAALTHLDRQWNYITGLPDPRYPGTNRGLHAVNPDSAWVDADGKRFIAERSSTKFGLPVMTRLKGGTYWSIFDEASKRSLWLAGSDWAAFEAIEKHIFSNPALIKSAPTLAALAEKSGLPANTLQATIERWNQMVERGNDEDFGRFGPGKEFKPKKIGKPPFYAMQLFPLTRKSMGGVAIDTSGRVLDAAQRVIPGLYAVGELTGVGGINGKAALEGTFLAPSIIIGRVAGRAALQEIGSKPAPAPNQLPSPTTSPTTDSRSACMSCHPLPELLKSPRAGYWHFEKVHGVVLERNFDCMKCHSELQGDYTPTTHRVDRILQSNACPTCHSGEDR